MSVTGLTNSLLPNLGSLGRPDATRSNPGADRAQTANTQTSNAQQAAAQARAAQTATLKPQTPIAGQATAQHTVPAEAPAGTDPTLWSVLTTEERNFFAKTAALGPLTYGRLKAATMPTPPAARGVRLDVRA